MSEQYATLAQIDCTVISEVTDRCWTSAANANVNRRLTITCKYMTSCLPKENPVLTRTYLTTEASMCKAVTPNEERERINVVSP